MKIRQSIYTRGIKPIIFSFPPDGVHEVTMHFLALINKIPGMTSAVRAVSTSRHPELELDWEGMHFSSPFGLSAGLDKNGQAIPIMQAVGFGFSTVGSVTARRCYGNQRPWFYRLPHTQSLVVHAGLANLGVDTIVPRIERLNEKYTLDYPTVLSVARTNDEVASTDEAGIEDFLISVRKGLASPAVQIIELNISCPNAICGESFTNAKLFARLLDRIAELKPEKPFFVKMPIELPWNETKALLDAANKAPFIKGLTFGNLKKDRSDIDSRDQLPERIKGNLSGAPTRKQSTELVFNTYKEYGDRFTIIGVGGILSAEDAYEKIRAGATFIEGITGLIMNGPTFPEDVNKGLVKLLYRDGFTHISEAVGAAHRS